MASEWVKVDKCVIYPICPIIEILSIFLQERIEA